MINGSDHNDQDPVRHNVCDARIMITFEFKLADVKFEIRL